MNDAAEVVSYALDLLDEVRRCVRAQPLDESVSLTILEVVEEAEDALLAYYHEVVERRKGVPRV